jgi:hypothetical protein
MYEQAAERRKQNVEALKAGDKLAPRRCVQNHREISKAE